MKKLLTAFIFFLSISTAYAGPAREYANTFGQIDDSHYELLMEIKKLQEKKFPIMELQDVIALKECIVEARLVIYNISDLFMLLDVMETKKDRNSVIAMLVGVYEEPHGIVYRNSMRKLNKISENEELRTLALQIKKLFEAQEYYLSTFYKQVTSNKN